MVPCQNSLYEYVLGDSPKFELDQKTMAKMLKRAYEILLRFLPENPT